MINSISSKQLVAAKKADELTQSVLKKQDRQDDILEQLRQEQKDHNVKYI
jgi:hypothetical protein